MIMQFLISLQRQSMTGLVTFVCQVAYLLKGFGWVNIRYDQHLKVYEYNIKGMIFVDTRPGWGYYQNAFVREMNQTFSFFYQPKVGDCIVDVGAGIGEESVVYASVVGPTGSVLAIEANPTAFNRLKFLCERNGFSWVTPLNLAVYSFATEVSIEDHPDSHLSNTINSNGEGTVTVQADSLDNIVARHGIRQIDFLKCNIEGAEKFMIEGMGASIAIIKNVCISCHDFRHTVKGESDFFVTKRKVIDFLLDHGFRILPRETNDFIIRDFVYASRDNDFA